MSLSLEKFDEALRIGAEELQALEAGDLELAEQCSERRETVVAQAWQIRDAGKEALREKLEALQELQNKLIQAGEKLKKDIQESLSKSKQQRQRMKGYGLAVRQAQFYL